MVGLGATGAILALAFVAHESRTAEPILPIRLFRLGVFSIVTGLSFLMGCAMFGALVFLPLYMQTVEGASATGSGVRLLPIITGIMGASVVTGRLISRWGRYKPFCVAGMTGAPLCLFVLSQLDRDTPDAVYGACMALLGVSMGMVMPVTMLAVPSARRGTGLDVTDALAASIQSVLLTAVPLLVVGFVLTLLLREVPLKETAYVAGPVGAEAAMAPERAAVLS